MSKPINRAAPSKADEMIERIKTFIADFAESLEEPLSLIDAEGYAGILVDQVTEKKVSIDKVISMFSESAVVLHGLNRAFVIRGGLPEEAPELMKAVESAPEIMRLKAFLYQVISTRLRSAARPENVYYAQLSHQLQEEAAKVAGYKKPEQVKDSAICKYQYARFLEIVHPNSKDQAIKACELYSSVASIRSIDFKGVMLPPHVDWADVKLAIMQGKTFEDIKRRLASIRSRALSPSITSLIEAEEVWVELCHKASFFKSEDPKLRDFLFYIKQKSAQEFISLEERSQISEEEKTSLEPREVEHLLGLAKRCKELRNFKLISIENRNLFSLDKTAELIRMFAEGKPEYPKLYLECLLKGDNLALYNFYLNYQKHVSPEARAQYLEEDAELYGVFATKSSQYILEAAGWSGNADAQYLLANEYLKQAQVLQAEISSEENQERKKDLIKKFGAKKARRRQFLILAANNEHVDAKFALANAMELGSNSPDDIGAIVAKEGLEYKYYLDAFALGHEGAKAKCDDVERALEHICANIKKINSVGIKFLNSMREYSQKASLNLAICFLEGYGVKQDANTALTMLESLCDVSREDVSSEARKRIAYYKFSVKKDFSSFARLLESETHRHEAFSIVANILTSSDAVDLKEVYKIILNFKGFYDNIPKKEKPKYSDLNKFIQDTIEKLALNGLAEARVDMAAKVITETAISDVTARRGALLMLLKSVSNDDKKVEVKIAEQILLLLKSPNILPEDLSVAQIEHFFQPGFLSYKADLGSKLRYELSQKIEEFAKQKSGQEKDVWNEKIMALLKLSAGATPPFQLARARIVLYCADGGYRANIDELREIEKWYKSSGVNKSLAMARLVYREGVAATEDDKKAEYRKQFLFYSKLVAADKLVTVEEKKEFQAECSAWMEEAVVKVVEPAAAPAVVKAKAVEVVKEELAVAKMPEEEGEGENLGAASLEAEKSKAKKPEAVIPGPKKPRKLSADEKRRLQKDRKAEEAREKAAAKAVAMSVAEEDAAEEDKDIVTKNDGELASKVVAEVGRLEPKPEPVVPEPEIAVPKPQPKPDLGLVALEPEPAALAPESRVLEPETPTSNQEATDLDEERSRAITAERAQELALKRQVDGEAMGRFLVGPRIIRFMGDLPLFLQENVRKLSQDLSKMIPPKSFYFLLKGSAVYAGHGSKRVPSDLDCEFGIEGMHDWPDKDITKVIGDCFDIDSRDISIYKTDDVFTVNAKDATRKVDLSFYGDKKKPSESLGWTTNREAQILFDQWGGGNIILPKGFYKHCQDYRIYGLQQYNLIINPEARGLILRLCFLDTIGVVFDGELIPALSQIAKNPLELLYKELKLERVMWGDYSEVIRDKIIKFTESHSIKEDLMSRFVATLLSITTFGNANKATLSLKDGDRERISNEPLEKIHDVVKSLAKEFSIAPPAPLPVLHPGRAPKSGRGRGKPLSSSSIGGQQMGSP